jgi:hypothetical protein
MPTMKTRYFVIGGVFTSTEFTALEPEGGEIHGPFATLEEADEAWKTSTGRNFDICCHKLFVVPVEVPE